MSIPSIIIPGDKSISHRSVLFGSLALGETVVTGFLQSDDCLHTLECMNQMGVESEWSEGILKIRGRGLHGLQQPKDTLYVGNSGTSIRLMSGVLAGQSFASSITGDDSICRRPMKRVVDPLQLMGANISSENGLAPIHFEPALLKGISYASPVASAQVKSCLLLAGLYAKGAMDLGEPYLSRDHTERMMRQYGIRLSASKDYYLGVRLEDRAELKAQAIHVPADVSSAAFLMVAALIKPGTHIKLLNIGVNPTRKGVIDVLIAMGADITLHMHSDGCEPMADIEVKTSELHGVELNGDIIPNIIDEIPILCIAAAAATGVTRISDAKELRVKESDRIEKMVALLKALQVKVEEHEDGMTIFGNNFMEVREPFVLSTDKDHRIAMSAKVAELKAGFGITIDDESCMQTSFPGFLKTLSVVQGV